MERDDPSVARAVAAARVATRLAAAVAGAGRVLTRVIGAPDYDAYLAHARTHHPERVMTREEFLDSRLAQRYEKPGSKCC